MSQAPAEQATPKVTPEAPRRGRRPLIVLVILATLVGGGMLAYHQVYEGQETTDDAQIEAGVVPVSSRVAGVVQRLLVDDEQHVEAGQILVELDPADFDARVRQAEAELATAEAQAFSAQSQVAVVEATSKGGLSSAKATLSGSSSAVKSAEAQMSIANAALRRAQSDFSKAEQEFNRAKALSQQDAISQASLDSAQASYDNAFAALDSTKAQVIAAEDAKRIAQSRVAEAAGRVDQSDPEVQINAANSAVALAQARVKTAQAALETAKLQRGYTTVRAPRAGWVAKLGIHEGQFLQVGQPLVELVPEETYVIANFKETQIAAMQEGQAAEISIDAFPGQHFHGKIANLSHGTGARFSLLPPDNASGNFVKVVQRVPIRVDWAPLPAGIVLRPGLSAEVTVFTKPE